MASSQAVSLASNAINMPEDSQSPCCPDGQHDHKNGHRNPTIFDAVKSGMLVPVQSFVETQGPDIFKSRDEKGHLPAHWACLGGHTTILRYILEHKGPFDEPSDNELAQRPVHWACVNGHVAVVDILLQAGVSIDVLDNKGCTPLIVACQYGHTMLAGYLMGRGARLQNVDKDGDTALHWATFKGHNELMRLLVYSGFNPHQRDNFGQTPLHLACINGNLTSVKDLCEQDGVEINLVDKNGKTPLMLATGRKHQNIMMYLKKESKMRTSVIPKIDFWAVVFGPPGNHKGPLLFFVISMLCWAYPMYIFKCLPMTWYELQVPHIIFMGINVIIWISLYHASTSDPGFLPRNIPAYDQAIKQVAHFDEWKQGRNPLSRLCHTCRTVKPMRSKHCRICNRCVRGFDHHCPYIYNCVGIKNRVWFFLFMTCTFICGLMTDYFAIYLLQTMGWDWLVVLGLCEILFFSVIASLVFGFTLYLWRAEGWPFYIHYIVGFLETIFFMLIALFVAGASIYHMVLNLTTNERINQKRYKYLQDGKGKYYNPYDRGWKNNVLEFFFLKRAMNEDEVEFLNVTVV